MECESEVEREKHRKTPPENNTTGQKHTHPPTYRNSSSHLIFTFVRNPGDVSVAMSTKSSVQSTSVQKDFSRSPSIVVAVVAAGSEPGDSSRVEEEEEGCGGGGGARRATYCLGYMAA
jgi:hypothetical protein